MEESRLFYSVSDVAEELGVTVATVRFWANTFDGFVRPKRNKKGNRMFSAKDLDVLRQVYYLVKEKGMTLEGAARRLAAGCGDVSVNVEIKTRLESLKSELEDILKLLK